jgi:hypothetical protein
MKYIVEGGVDFYKELLDSLSDKIQKDIDSNKCLITYDELNDFYVELNCGHKFNYGPLYKDIFNYKRRFNNMEQTKNKLKINEIRCPYCRAIHSKLLPYYEKLPYPKEHGVNYLDQNKMNNDIRSSFVSSSHQCQYENIITDESSNTFINKCFNYGCIQYKLKEKYNITNKYCYQHKNLILKELKQQEKDKIKEEKLKIKEENKKVKEAAKILAKLEKLEKKQSQQLLKNTVKLNHVDNIVISNDIIITDDIPTTVNGCIAILKSGNRKGNNCCATIYKNSLCKRHLDLHLKNKDIKV